MKSFRLLRVGLIIHLAFLTLSAHADGGIYLPNLKAFATGTASGGTRALDISGNLTTTVPSVGDTGSAVPAKADYVAGNKAGNLTGVLIGQQTMANSLACVLPSDQSAIPVSESGAWSVAQSGGWSVSQTGTWNITNVSGTISLPTGAATSANQTTANTSLASIDTKTPALGQTTKSASQPVTMASDQYPINSLTTTANISSLNGALTVNTNGFSVAGVVVSGTWSGTLSFQGSVDGTNWNNIFGSSNQNSISNATFVSSMSSGSNGSNFIINTSGFAQFRVSMTSYTSGTAAVTVNQTIGQGYSFGYSANRIYDSSGTAITEGQGTMSTSLPVVIASNQTAVPTSMTGANAPSNPTGSFTQSLVVGSSGTTTLTKPSNGVGFILYASSSNTVNVRWAVGSSASTTSGMRLEPGRDTGWIPIGANVSVEAESGSNQEVDIQWAVNQ